jgi:hypothetical protein
VKRAAIPLLVAVLAACVPTDPDKEQLLRGGLAVTFAPSEATAGAPFQTRDGWTVKIETTAIRVVGSAQAVTTADSYYGGYGYGEPHVIDPRYVCEVRVTGMAAGDVTVDMGLQSDQFEYLRAFKEGELCGISDATARRFQTRADDMKPPTTPQPEGYIDYQNSLAPSVYVKGHAEKNGRRVAFDLALAATGNGSIRSQYDDDGELQSYDRERLVRVVPNQGTPVRFEVHFESMFARGIDELAAADSNRDGNITGAELRAVQVTCDSSYGDNEDDDYGDDDDDYTYPGKDYSGDDCPTLADQLRTQASTILGPQIKTR